MRLGEVRICLRSRAHGGVVTCNQKLEMMGGTRLFLQCSVHYRVLWSGSERVD